MITEDAAMKNLAAKLVPMNYLNIASDARKQKDKKIKILLEKRKLPDQGFDDLTIESLVNELASLDSNNFLNKCGVGEREARIACDLVRRRHYNLGHGIGRSGDLEESQPKAIGSSLMNQLTNSLLLDLMKSLGIRSAAKCFLIPISTGFAITLCLLTLKAKKGDAKYVLWSRIDQKSCIKCILTANLIPVIIEPIRVEDELVTDIMEFENQIQKIGANNIVAIISTSSCFAPRACDDLDALSILAKKYNLYHVVNNAYGLQSTFLTHQIEQAHRNGHLDLFIQSTDKNLCVPVGGAVIAGFCKNLVGDVSKFYPGRASASQTLDVFMTLLSLGKNGYMKLVQDRKDCFFYLRQKLRNVANRHNEKILLTKKNPISVAMSLENFDKTKLTMIGSMLFTRGVSGSRVITTSETKTLEGHKFKGWGSHISNSNNIPYLTAAASLGMTKEEVDSFTDKLDKVLLKVRSTKLAVSTF